MKVFKLEARRSLVLGFLVLMPLSMSQLLIANKVFAHADHDHSAKKPVKVEAAKAEAVKNVSRLIGTKKLDDSWKKVKVLAAEKKKFGHEIEWVVTFLNPSVKDKSKQKLFVFLKISGEFLAANYTGQ